MPLLMGSTASMHTELGTTNITAITPTGGPGAKYTPTINTSYDSVNAGNFIKFNVAAQQQVEVLHLQLKSNIK